MSKIGKFLEKKKGTILSLIGFLFMLLLAGGIGAYVAIYQTYCAQKYMDDYYNCFLNESYMALYSSSGVEDSDFINANTFNNMMINEYGYEETDKYSVSKMSKSGKNARATVTFTDSTTDEEVSWELRMEKSDKSHYLFFKEWNVNIDDFIVENVKIVTDKEVEVVIDEKNITTEKLKSVRKTVDEETGLCTYIIDKMFLGAHTILFIGQNTEVESVLASFDKEHKYYDFKSGVFKKQYQQELSSSVTKIIVETYNSAFNASGIENLSALFAKKEGMTERVMTVYTNMINSINKDDGSTLSSIDITDYSITFDKYDFDENVRARFYYTANFTAKGGRTIDYGVRDTYEGTATSEAYITFELIDGTWQATDIEIECIDYSQPEEVTE